MRRVAEEDEEPSLGLGPPRLATKGGAQPDGGWTSEDLVALSRETTEAERTAKQRAVVAKKCGAVSFPLVIGGAAAVTWARAAATASSDQGGGPEQCPPEGSLPSAEGQGRTVRQAPAEVE